MDNRIEHCDQRGFVAKQPAIFTGLSLHFPGTLSERLRQQIRQVSLNFSRSIDADRAVTLATGIESHRCRWLNECQTRLQLVGRTGSRDLVHQLVQAVNPIVQSGRCRVTVDHTELAHEADHWLDLTHADNANSLWSALVEIRHSNHQVHSVGMHCFGRPDIYIGFDDRHKRQAAVKALADTIQYLYTSDREFGEFHFVGDDTGLRYITRQSDPHDIENCHLMFRHPMINPFGGLSLIPVASI